MPPTAVVSKPPAPPPTSITSTRAPWPGAIWALLAGTFLVRAAGCVYPFLAWHLTDRGLGGTQLTVVLALFGAGWLAGQVIGGASADRFGRRVTLTGSMLLAAVVFPVLAQAHTLPALAAAAFVSGAVYDAARPVVSAVIADTVEDEPTRARIAGWRYFAVNIGVAITGALGGTLAESVGLPVLFWCNGLVCAGFGVVAWLVMPAETLQTRTARHGYRSVLADPRLVLLWLASLCGFIPMSALYAVLPQMMAQDHLPAAAYGWAQVTAAIAVLVLSPLFNPWLARRAQSKHPMVGPLGASCLILGLGMGSAGLVSTPAGYAAAVVASVPGEIIATVAAADIVNRIAPAHARGRYAGIWGTSLAASVLAAPLLAGWALEAGGHHLVGLTLAGCGLIGAGLCLPLTALARRPAAALRCAS